VTPNACVFALICVCVPQLFGESPPAEALLRLEGKELVKAAEEASYGFYNEVPYTAAELTAIAEKLIGSVRSLGSERDSDEMMSPFGAYFGQACLKVGNEQLDKLVDIYARLDPMSFEKSSVLPALASRLIAREVEAIRTEKRKLTLGKTDSTLPTELKAAPQELREAWRAYQAVKVRFDTAFPKTSEQIEVSANQKSFYRLIESALGGATGLQNEIREFAWTGANCLGITDIEDAQDIAVLLMLLRERKLEEAMGAALRVVGTEGSTSSPEATAGSVVALFEACGLDWETIFAGGQAANELRGWDFGSTRPYLAALANYGSERSGLLLNQLAHLAKPEARGAYVAAFGSCIETAANRRKCNGNDVDVGRSNSGPRHRKPLPHGTQVMLLHVTEDFAGANCPEDIALYAINIFGRTQAASSVPALQGLKGHMSSDVSQTAATVLCAMGLGGPASEENAPVRFRILLNGEAIAPGQGVAWMISSTKNTVSSTTEVNQGGIVELSRQYFAKVSAPAKEVEFSMQGDRGGVEFNVTIPPPAKLDAITEVPVTLSRLEITLTNQDRLNGPPPETAHVLLIAHREQEDVSLSLPDASDGTYRLRMGTIGADVYQQGYEKLAQPSIVLPAVQNGTYDVFIGVAGAEVWHGLVKVGPDTSKVAASLQPGSDVRFEIVTPAGQRNPWARIFQDGKEFDAKFDWKKRMYRSLPRGNYVVRIFGSEPTGDRRDAKKLKKGPDEIPYAGRDVEFTIKHGSPALIDLGEIHLEAIPDQE
jgi:hypothetical protein